MFINATTERPGTLRGQLRAVPWSTVVPLAALLAYADGFWLVSLRGAVGAIERTQDPFASWLRDSTLVLPIFVLAVLAALTLAARWFGPVPRTPRIVVATALMVVAACTLVGIAEVAAGAAYDYHLQSGQAQLLGSMGSMGHTNAGVTAQLEQGSLGLQRRAVGYGSAILLVTNLALVGWAVALRGGRLDTGTTQAADRPRNSRADGLRLVLAAALFGSGAVNAAGVPEHLGQWPAAGAFFVVLAAAELAVAGLLVARL